MNGPVRTILMKLNIQEKSFIANLTTVGRKTGQSHTVHIRLVFHNDRFYASRRSMSGDWLKNILKDPSVIVGVSNDRIKGKATVVEDKELLKTISSLKYNDERSLMERVVVEIIPY
jgi:deazaflavin-dependent oxidoreductase (nitroreductase family)